MIEPVLLLPGLLLAPHGGHFLPPVSRELKILAAQESTTMAELLREAITLLLVKRGRPTVDKLEGVK